MTPRQFYGIEKDLFAAKLAHVVTWIGYLQWRYEDDGVLHPQLPRSRAHPRQLPNPILQDKNHPDEPDRIICADSIMRFTVADEKLPSLRSGEGNKLAHTRTSAELWEQIKPLAREMRKEPTPAEDALWQRLRRKQLHSLRFRRQHPIDRFIVDFFCAEAQLVIEVDGSVHEQQQEYDELRQMFIESRGLRVLRFTNDEVLGQIEGVLERIGETVQSPPPDPLPAAQGGGSGMESVRIPYEPDWPEVDVIMGNPPFLGGKRLRDELGDTYLDSLFQLYQKRVPAEADLVCYWYEKARAHIAAGKAKRAGLLATNSIRSGTNRVVLDRIKQSGDIFLAWGDRPWVLEGAAVRIALVGFDDGSQQDYLLDGAPVTHINSDLQNTIDATKARRLSENLNLTYMGVTPGGPFDITEDQAQAMLNAPLNTNQRPNSDVVRLYYNAKDLVQHPRNAWTINFTGMTEAVAANYTLPYAYVKEHIRPARFASKQPQREKDQWWIYTRSRPEMYAALEPLSRYIATPMVSKHRVFVWLSKDIVPANLINVVVRDDDYFLGVLHSQPHELWSLRLGSSLEDRPRYTPTTTFETFPFPWLPDQEDTHNAAYQAIAEAAQQLHTERDAWLNPTEDLLDGPARDTMLRQLTLTNLYNALVEYRERMGMSSESAGAPQRNGAESKGRGLSPAQAFAPRLHELHARLDHAVCDAYGWSPDILTDDEEMLRRLLALNLQRAAVG